MELSDTTNNPIAWLRCYWQSTCTQGKGSASISKARFKGRKIVVQTELCVGVLVIIEGVKISPKYVCTIVSGERWSTLFLTKEKNPNSKHDYYLPKYIVIYFPHLDLKRGNLQPWDVNNPTVRQ